MAVQGGNKETEKNIVNTASNHQADGGSQPEPVVLLNAMSFGAERSPKARKPYTISKQREKWTDEEHQRFLEALKLYGRGWRQIQDHVGTKTAVQIRSHAQKFFSKVVRESNGIEETLANPIDIPPPRPKKKPLHPYPRKSLESLKAKLVPKQALRSPSPNLLAVGDKEIHSPTSIFTGFGSEEMGSACSEQSNICVSPTSCTSDVHFHTLSPLPKEYDNVSSDSEREEAKASMSSLNLSTNLTLGHFLSMELTSAFENNESVEDESAMGSSVRRIKLFGSTVLVTDNEHPSSQTSPASKIDLDNNTRNEKLDKTYPRNQNGTWNLIPFVSPINKEGFEHKNDYAQESIPKASLQLWPFCHGVPFYNTASMNSQSDGRIIEERSCTDSNPGPLTKGKDEGQRMEVVVSQRQEAHASGKKSIKGFVPYKRCLESRETSSCLVASEDRSRQKARVCTYGRPLAHSISRYIS